jgi:acetoacetate decarboxylase
VQRLGIDYTISGQVVTLNFSTQTGDTVYAIYFT